MNKITIPTEYKEYSKVNLCSNKLENVKYFFGINDFPPLLIGRGVNTPICWLYVKNNNTWSRAISANNSTIPFIQIFASLNKLIIQFGSEVILDSCVIGDNELMVNRLNLKPVGLLIEGDSTGLTVGSQRISDNTIKGGRFFIGLG